MSRPPKIRLDQLLVDRGLAESRARAQAMILAGQVYSGEKRLDKAGTPTPEDIAITVRGQPFPWVSRGGLKLEAGLNHFGFDVTDKIALDVGASTGGFTDVLLSRGAAKIYAVDVGYGQLASRIRNDPRVVTLERTNARYLSPDQIPEPIDIVVCDASFIGLATVLNAALDLVADGGVLVALIKPQFEAGREHVGKGGVVRDPAVHQAVCDRVTEWLNNRPGWEAVGITTSPITGPNGNVEFLIGGRYTKP